MDAELQLQILIILDYLLLIFVWFMGFVVGRKW